MSFSCELVNLNIFIFFCLFYDDTNGDRVEAGGHSEFFSSRFIVF